MTILFLYCAICYLWMIGFLWDIKVKDKLERTFKTLSIIFAPIILPFMIGKIAGNED